MLKSSIILVLLAVAVNCHFEDEFQTIGNYDRPDKTSKTWYLSTEKSTWSKAVKECKSHGMKLATFGSDEEEADELLSIYSSSSIHLDAFIGYTDEEDEGTFITFEGKELEIDLDFHKDQPNNFKSVQHCLELCTVKNVVKYNDERCNVKQQFICELENLIIIGSYEKPDKTSKTWYLSTGNSTWSEAVEECKEYGMNLATFGSDEEEADALLKIYSSLCNHVDAFIGYTDEEDEGTFTTFEGETLEIDLNFHKNEPNNGGGVEHCLELYTLKNVVKYNDESCNVRKQFICESENECQSCDSVKKDNIRLQNELDEAESNLKYKERLLKVEKYNHKSTIEKCNDEIESLEKTISMIGSSIDPRIKL